MAVFGLQLVLTMVMASVLSKLLPHYSLAKWLLCKRGLKYYLHPTDEELRIAAGVPKKTKMNNNKTNKNSYRRGGGGNVEEDTSTFSIPRNTEVKLEESLISPDEVMALRFYPDYQWLIDFAVCSAIVYTVSEIYLFWLPPKGEVNLSMLWCLLVVGFSLKIMFSLTMLYFRGDSGGEKAMVVLSFFIYLLIALGFLIISEEKLDLGLDLAYSSFNQSATAFLKYQGLESEAPTSKTAFKMVLAFFSAFIGAFYTFPGLRLGKMHWDCLRNCGDRKALRMLFHASFLSPILLVLLWVRPLTRRYFTEVIFSGYSQPIMSPGMFDASRIVLVIIVALLRLTMMPYYLQSYLNMAHEKIVEMKKESGKISSIDFQRKIARVFYYLCVVTLQYAAPIILCTFLALMYKTLGGHSWSQLYLGLYGEDQSAECGLSPDEEAATFPLPSLSKMESIADASKSLSLSLEEFKKIFTTEFYRGILGFSTWWCCFSWFLSGTFGFLYQSYFTHG